MSSESSSPISPSDQETDDMLYAKQDEWFNHIYEKIDYHQQRQKQIKIEYDENDKKLLQKEIEKNQYIKKLKQSDKLIENLKAKNNESDKVIDFIKKNNNDELEKESHLKQEIYKLQKVNCV